MADYSWQESQKMTSSQGSAVLEMQLEDDVADDMSDYSDTGFNDTGKDSSRKDGSGDDMRKRLTENVGEIVWQAGKQRAQKAWGVYGNIDILRPYFDVEPKEVQKRLLYSLIPERPTSTKQRVPRELYGPLMVIFTLIALLLFQMKTSDHKVEEGTLMGTAFGVCFIYWFGAAGLIWVLSYVCGVRIAMLQILSMLGYALFSHCVVLFLGTVIHTSHDHILFYVTWALIGGLSTVKMGCIIFSRASGKTERIVIIALIAVLHLSFLLYLHFAYHSVVEELSMVFDSKLVPPPIAQEQVDQKIPRGLDNVENMAIHVTNKIINLGSMKPVLGSNKSQLAINQSVTQAIKEVPVMLKGLTGGVVNAINKTMAAVVR